MELGGSSWPELSGGKAVLAAGSFEQHGPHLPLSTDTIIAEAVAAELAAKTGASLGPTMPFGVSPEHMGFSGTVTLSEETFKRVVSEVIESLGKHGFSDIVVVNGHGGNNRPLDELGVRTVNITRLMKPYDHAGDVETSLIMHLRPKLVRADQIKKHEFSWPGKREWKDTREFSRSGVLGDPTAATAKKGEAYLRQIVEAALAQIQA
jgi:creatinine amidohydrolase/Fe(II)-dependent formamide hydrolase-like protein